MEFPENHVSGLVTYTMKGNKVVLRFRHASAVEPDDILRGPKNCLCFVPEERD